MQDPIKKKSNSNVIARRLNERLKVLKYWATISHKHIHIRLSFFTWKCFRDDEILDSFDGDSFGGNNVDTPTIQRRAFRNQASGNRFRRPRKNSRRQITTSISEAKEDEVTNLGL